MTKRIPEHLQDTFESSLYRNAELATAVLAISQILKANSGGNIPDMNKVGPGLHCALSILSGEQRKLADSSLDFIDLPEGSGTLSEAICQVVDAMDKKLDPVSFDAFTSYLDALNDVSGGEA